MSLEDSDDEQRLVQRLQEFRRLCQKDVEVFFDKAPAGQARTQKFGMVLAHFITERSDADSAIAAHLRALGPKAKNKIVVSSDHRVQDAAKQARARVMTSEQFIDAMNRAVEKRASGDRAVQAEEWYEVFQVDPDQAEQPIPITREKRPPSAPRPKKRSHHGFPSKKNTGS